MRQFGEPRSASAACVLSRFSGWIFRPAARVFIPWRRCPPNPAVGGAAISVLAIRIWRSARLAPAVS